jgi:hypothetical protein
MTAAALLGAHLLLKSGDRVEVIGVQEELTETGDPILVLEATRCSDGRRMIRHRRMSWVIRNRVREYGK